MGIFLLVKRPVFSPAPSPSCLFHSLSVYLQPDRSGGKKKSASYTWRKALSTLFHIHDLTDADDWLMPQVTPTRFQLGIWAWAIEWYLYHYIYYMIFITIDTSSIAEKFFLEKPFWDLWGLWLTVSRVVTWQRFKKTCLCACPQRSIWGKRLYKKCACLLVALFLYSSISLMLSLVPVVLEKTGFVIEDIHSECVDCSDKTQSHLRPVKHRSFKMITNYAYCLKWNNLSCVTLFLTIALNDDPQIESYKQLGILKKRTAVMERKDKKVKRYPTCARRGRVACLPEKKLVLGLGDTLSMRGGAVDPNKCFGLEKEITVLTRTTVSLSTFTVRTQIILIQHMLFVKRPL